MNLRLSSWVAAVLLAVAACRSPQSPICPPDSAASIPAPPPDAERAVDLAGLHNVVSYATDSISGGVPEGAQGLATLAAMGVKTVVSVDGAVPDVAGAEALGMRYVHLPISYNCVPEGRQVELAQALRTLPGPIYVHCHHGKHRSAAALASGLVRAGRLTPEQAMSRMAASGTSKDYPGLWRSVREGRPLDDATLRGTPAAFPSVATVSGMVATMAEIDLVFDGLKAVRKAGWRPPQDHPDLVPTQAAARLSALLAQVADEPATRSHAGDLAAKFADAVAQSAALAAAVRANDPAAAEARFTLVEKSCKQCHNLHRDN